jgi:hypothetical protein
MMCLGGQNIHVLVAAALEVMRKHIHNYFNRSSKPDTEHQTRFEQPHDYYGT